MRRLRAIEVEIDLHAQQLAEAYELRESPEQWRRLAEAWDFSEVNDLIERHNRHYPAESRLPMNPRTGDFVLVNGRPYTRELLDADWILTRFPAAGQT
jgi:FtsP/CotA-like multicopper oxidase with cupredoxin domain